MSEPRKLELTSTEFENGATIPAKYTCDGDRLLNPPLTWSGEPEGTKSFALIVEDPDIPNEIRQERGIMVFDHWVLFNIPATTHEIEERSSAGISGLNSAGTIGYRGPCPPKEYEPMEHRYFFRLYALDCELPPSTLATKNDVISATEGHVLSTAELMGRYQRH